MCECVYECVCAHRCAETAARADFHPQLHVRANGNSSLCARTSDASSLYMRLKSRSLCTRAWRDLCDWPHVGRDKARMQLSLVADAVRVNRGERKWPCFSQHTHAHAHALTHATHRSPSTMAVDWHTTLFCKAIPYVEPTCCTWKSQATRTVWKGYHGSCSCYLALWLRRGGCRLRDDFTVHESTVHLRCMPTKR